ncbi:LCP family protein [Actinacidiphila paucisporea]|uniref:Transcriptional attenuator, LytR family n=1 Tax=Actinacidiphila paucisporea TaxID=310782 RepID=A0A1M7FAK4_9ACTN|nr:LCP family protein [Actinacidiphila paucisporea]SHM00749.1 transcriptional attenuator, LytR family [Actinacidiphila paucisporea]
MDTQGRDDIDPADQWVIDPATGAYRRRQRPEQDPARKAGLPRQAGRAPTAPATVPAPRTRRTPGADGPAGRRKGRPPGRGPSRRRKALLWTAGSLGLVLVAVGVGGYLVYEHFNGNLTTVDVGDAGSKDVLGDGPLNLLVIGTDSRQGTGGAYGDPDNLGHADTTILFHVSADRGNATAMSIPRDIVTSIPACPTRHKDGTTTVIPGIPAGPTTPKFNESLGVGGRDPGCTMRAVTALTGIPVDHFMMVDFEAVKALSTAVGGVDVCLARPLVDPKSHLDLSAGPHRIEGEQALQFVRTRHALRNQSDLDRIKLQQLFLGAMIRKIKSSGTLTNPGKLFTLANVATRALTVDSAIGSVSKLTSLAKGLSKVDARHITFTTLPVVDNPAEKVHATVVVDQARARRLLTMIKDDVPLSRRRKRPRSDALLRGPKAAPADVRVRVYNGSGILGAARGTVAWLRGTEGVGSPANGGNAPAPAARTTLVYAPEQAAQARALAAMLGLPGSALRPSPGAGGAGGTDPAGTAGTGAMALTLGADFTRAGVPVADPDTPPDGLDRTEADNSSCVS